MRPRSPAQRPASADVSSAVDKTPRADDTTRQLATEPALVTDDPPPQFAALVERARERAESAYVPPVSMPLSGPLQDNYDAYRNIRFRPERSLWRDEPGRFESQFFHPGFYYRNAVGIYVIENENVRELPFSTQLFSYQGVPEPKPERLGFTGLRLHAPLNSESYRDEVIVFQGASYFRSLGRGQVYGLSARALAIDTGEPTPEEFPRFSELHLVRPAPDADCAWVLALLDSEHASGAYAFRIQPGETTQIEVSARVFMRSPTKVVGIAPMSSMFLFGEESPARFHDFRPEVHDSDGLMMWGKGGERIFRPLCNPPRTTVSSFRLDSPRAFGLVQRDREFESYQDLEARYQDRPSAWVEPLGDWGPGSVRLLEIATAKETDDNIAMLWVPDRIPKEGLSLRYRLSFGDDMPMPKTVGHVSATRITRLPKGQVRFLVDFTAEGLAERKDVEAHVTASGARILEQHTEPNRYAGGSRAVFDLLPNAKEVELRVFLRDRHDVLTETWSYLWQPTP